MIKRTLLLFMLLLLTACAKKNVREVKHDTLYIPLWALIVYEKASITPVSEGVDELKYEDKRFMYTVYLDRPRAYSFSNIALGACDYQGGTFTVVDKKAQKVVVDDMYVEQRSCRKCHNK